MVERVLNRQAIAALNIPTSVSELIIFSQVIGSSMNGNPYFATSAEKINQLIQGSILFYRLIHLFVSFFPFIQS